MKAIRNIKKPGFKSSPSSRYLETSLTRFSHSSSCEIIVILTLFLSSRLHPQTKLKCDGIYPTVCFIFKSLNVALIPPSSPQMSARKDPSSVRIREVLLEMRRYRMGLIQTADQLRFSYLAVIEGAKYIGGDTSLQVNNPPPPLQGLQIESRFSIFSLDNESFQFDAETFELLTLVRFECRACALTEDGNCSFLYILWTTEVNVLFDLFPKQKLALTGSFQTDV